MEDNLIELLETFKVPVFRQGSLSKDEKYPPTFFTFWCQREVEHSSYDDSTSIVEYNFDVNIYSNNPQEAYDLIRQAKDLLKNNRWIISEIGYDLPSDEVTHIGRGLNVTYLQQL